MSAVHAYPVFGTTYRRPVFSGEMLTFCDNIMCAV
jgi:hypothetical protein